jgi:Trypsin-co-occurring domain 1
LSINQNADAPAIVLVPVEVDGQKVYLSARGTAAQLGEEQEIGSRQPKLEQVIDGLAGFANKMMERLQDTGASRLSVQFGCEVAVESGMFVAVIGKASASSTFTVELEWAKPES